MTTTTVQALMAQMCPQPPCQTYKTKDKISIIGAGAIGAACLYTLVNQRIPSDMVLIDKDVTRVRDEVLDIENASVYMGSPNLTFGIDYFKSRDSKIVIITVGEIFNMAGEIDLEILKKNVNLYKEIIPQIVSYSPHCILIILTQPIDVMTYAAWKISGLPKNRVIGSGCALLAARFRNAIAQKVNVSAREVQAYIIGGNGKNCVPLWSSVSVCGIRLRDINANIGTENDPEDWNHVFTTVIQNAYNILKTKSYNTWGLAATVFHIVRSILLNTKDCISISTHIKGCRTSMDKDKDVFMSLPCIIGYDGVSYVVRQSLNDQEKQQLQDSAEKLNNIQNILEI